MDAEPGKVWPSPGNSGTVEGDLWAGNELHKHLMRALKPTGHRKLVWDEQVDIQPFVGLDLVVPSAGTVGGQMGTLAEATPFNWSPRGLKCASDHSPAPSKLCSGLAPSAPRRSE